MDIKRCLAVMLGSLASAGNAGVGNAGAGAGAAIVQLNGDGPAYLYAAQRIGPGDTVYFQNPKNDRPSCCGQTKGTAAVPLRSVPDAVEYDSARALYRYRLDVTNIPPALPFVGIAVIGNRLRVEQDGESKIVARQAATVTELRLCTSQEGVHVLSRSGGKAQSHLYLALGYDIDKPTCSPSLMKQAEKKRPGIAAPAVFPEG